jgi:hypothetical protein
VKKSDFELQLSFATRFDKIITALFSFYFIKLEEKYQRLHFLIKKNGLLDKILKLNLIKQS